jgi:hypothetical protein
MPEATGEEPTEFEWASAQIFVTRCEDYSPPIFELRKVIDKNGVCFIRTLWMSMAQLRTVAFEETV